MDVSIIIPTYNRLNLLCIALASVARQTYTQPPGGVEVIVVDDGSSDDTSSIMNKVFPFRLTCVGQRHGGATVARNLGAQCSHGELLVFMDDDIELLQGAINSLVQGQLQSSRAIIVGHLLTEIDHTSCSVDQGTKGKQLEPIMFTECMTGLLSTRRGAFFALGMFQDPTGGWPNWDDVDFGYRAHKAGYRILRNYCAQGVHHDSSTLSLASAEQRSYRASRSAVRLFQKYPDILPLIPMFHDKTPVDWHQDPPPLIVRKIVRFIASSRPVLGLFEQIAKLLDKRNFSSLRVALWRWVIGGYIFRGYQEGLREYPIVKANPSGR